MPKKSEKVKFLNAHQDICINDMLMLEHFEEDSDETQEKQNDILEELALTAAIAESSRYLMPFVHQIVPKSHYFKNRVLDNLDESRFKQLTRFDKATFNFILSIIKYDELFEGAASGKQFPVKTQLFITLYRLGSSGEGATLSKIASLFGVGDGGTIQNITNRVFDAILKHKEEYLKWPDEMERKEIVAAKMHELPHCIGYVDGTEIKLAERPTDDPESYFSRKHIYSLKVQAVCDHKLRFRHLLVGYPGSVHDARIFNNCALSRNPSQYFNDDEWIAGDSAYKLTPTLLTPFRTTTCAEPCQLRKRFNKRFSQYRIHIEHCFGLLKERFGSLKEVRLRVGDKESVQKACEWVVVCAILQNIGIDKKDNLNLCISDEIYYHFNDIVSLYVSETSEGADKRRAIMRLLNLE